MAPRRKKKSATTSQKRRRKNQSNSNKFAFYAIVLIAGAAGIVFYNQYGEPKQHGTTTTVAASKSQPKSNSHHFVEPDYQFYTLLPQNDNKTVATAPTQKSVSPTIAKTQVASASSTAPTTTSKQTANNATTPMTTANKPAPIETAVPVKVAPVVKPAHHYELQLASFHRYEDADELKAKLVLQGYPTSISSATVNGSTWYRLWAGPYATAGQAKTIQAQLEKSHLVAHTRVVEE
jgi:cell division protein FtsN